MSQPAKLTTTSYVILGHLALRDWTTYELAEQMKRSTRHFWPRAKSKIYEEPKKLAAHGLAEATREYTGRRPRTVYAITPKGRKALKRWLDEPTKLPVVEFDAAVKVQFAEQGTKQQLLATLHAVREQADDVRAEYAALAADLLLPSTRFPERRHVNELVMNFMWEQNEMVDRWAAWAEQQVASWPEDITRPDGPHVGEFLQDAARQAPRGSALSPPSSRTGDNRRSTAVHDEQLPHFPRLDYEGADAQRSSATPRLRRRADTIVRADQLDCREQTPADIERVTPAEGLPGPPLGGTSSKLKD